MAYPNTIKYYIDGMTPSPSAESRSTAEKLASIEPSSLHTVDRLPHEPHTASSRGTKRAGEYPIHDRSGMIATDRGTTTQRMQRHKEV
jgi:hypothetical protein